MDQLLREPSVIAALTALVTLIVAKVADGLLKKASFQMDDSALLRRDLMADNRELREEIRQMSDKVSEVQTQNSTLQNQVNNLLEEVKKLTLQLGTKKEKL